MGREISPFIIIKTLEEKMNVKINNKNYVVPKVTFEGFVRIESDLEINLLKAFQKKQIFPMTLAAVMFVTGADKEEAGELIEQHLLGGGTAEKIVGSFTEALFEAAFFKKMLGIEDTTPAKKGKKKVEGETPEETTEES